jgi:hypothetical protein
VFPSGLWQRVALFVVTNFEEAAAGTIMSVELKMDKTCFSKTLAAVYQATFYIFFCI